MLELLQVTAQYSNAVLIAIMPQISDFAKKLELPVPIPITVEHVREFKCSPMKGNLGGLVMFTNHLQVWYQLGHVNGFRTPRSYYNLQDVRDIPKFYGPLSLTKDEAIQLARDAIRKLGYTLKETFTDQEPEIDMPQQIGTNIVPHYQFRWKDPVFGRPAVKIEVDAGEKMIQEMRLLSLYFRREPPRIAVEPKLVNPRPPISVVVSNEFLFATLPKISEFAKKLKLPLKSPLTPQQVERVEFVNITSDVSIKLTNGYWFMSQHGVMAGFSAPDTVYGRLSPSVDPYLPPLEVYLGKWNMEEKDAIALVRQSLAILGFTVGEFHTEREPDVLKPDQVGNYVVPRYSFRWLTNNPYNGATIALVRAEVDANKKRLVHLSLVGGPLGRRENERSFQSSIFRPRSNQSGTLPMIFETNAPNEISIEDTIKFLDNAMGYETNATPSQRVPQRPANPYE